MGCFCYIEGVAAGLARRSGLADDPRVDRSSSRDHLACSLSALWAVGTTLDRMVWRLGNLFAVVDSLRHASTHVRLRADAQFAATLVALALAADCAGRDRWHLRHACIHRSAVQPLFSAGEERSCVGDPVGARGRSRRHRYPSVADVSDGCKREVNRCGCLCDRLRLVETHRGLGYDAEARAYG